jgi:hypothetical protein
MVSAEVGKGESEGLIACTFDVGDLIRTDWATKSDPVVCALLFDDTVQVRSQSISSLLICTFLHHPSLRSYAFHVRMDCRISCPTRGRN